MFYVGFKAIFIHLKPPTLLERCFAMFLGEILKLKGIMKDTEHTTIDIEEKHSRPAGTQL